MSELVNKMLSLGQTLIRMGINEGWWIDGGKVKWQDNYDGIKPSLAEIETKRVEFSKQDEYKQNRIALYPSVVDQLDMIYHDIKNDKLNKDSAFYKVIDKIKKDNPKGIRNE